MPLISYSFIFFITMTIMLYYSIFKSFQWQFLLFISLIFYLSYGFKTFLFSILISIIDYILAFYIDKSRNKNIKNYILFFSVLINVLFFMIIKINIKVFSLINDTSNFTMLGVSFYSLKNISYLIDISRKKYNVEKNVFKYLLYIFFICDIFQGPINKYDKIQKSLYKNFKVIDNNAILGFERILFGLFKKIVIANRIYPVVFNVINNELQGFYVFFALLMYSIELYMDFTGGIDIVIGIAQILQIDMIENFKTPYLSRNLKEFWQGWHISLSLFFKEYVFYPLSTSKWLRKFNKKYIKSRKFPLYFSLVIVWSLTGLWHGLNLKFLVWGLLNCLILIISTEYTTKIKKTYSKNLKKIDILRILRTFIIVSFLRVFDIYSSFNLALSSFFSIFSNSWLNIDFKLFNFSKIDFVIVLFGVFICFIVSSYERKNIDIRDVLLQKDYKLRHFVYGMIFIFIILFGVYSKNFEFNDFIYSHF